MPPKRRRADILSTEEEKALSSRPRTRLSSRLARHAEEARHRGHVTPHAAEADARTTVAAITHVSAQLCSTDTLGVIFSFLPLEDVASSAAACRRWADAIAAATVSRHRIKVPSVRTLRALAESPMRRLVNDIDLSSLTLVAADNSGSLWSAFPHLSALTCKIDECLLTEDTALRFPTTLRSLDVTFDCAFASSGWSQLDVLLSLAVRCPLRRLRVALPQKEEPTSHPSDAPPAGTIERLLALRDTITDLELDVKVAPNFLWTGAHIAVFRSLPHLTRLHASQRWWSSQELELLTAMPVSLPHLSSLDLDFAAVSAPGSYSFSRLLYPEPASLARLTQLETVEITYRFDADSETAPELAPALALCTNITDLTVNDVFRFPPAGLRDALPALRRLRRLELHYTPFDLACISSAPHLADTLELIDIGDPQSLSSLLHIRSLRRLQWAHIPVELDRRSELVELTEDECKTVFLPSLECLALHVRCGITSTIDLSRIFGLLPALRTFNLHSTSVMEHGSLLDLASLLPHLTRLTGLTTLALHVTSTSADLARVVSSMPHLRELDLAYEVVDLSFLSSAPSLARTIERLKINAENQKVSPRELLHLRSLRALKYLDLDLTLTPSSPESACESESQPQLSSLRELRLHLRDHDEYPDPPDEVTILLDLALLGPMPQLRSMSIHGDPLVQITSIADALAHSTRFNKLSLKNFTLPDADLISLLRGLPRLRSLKVVSSCLAFASAVPHLADTLEELHVRAIDGESLPLVVSDLYHLRALHQLRSLSLEVFLRRPGDSPHWLTSKDGVEFLAGIWDTDFEPLFRRECWPHLYGFVPTERTGDSLPSTWRRR